MSEIHMNRAIGPPDSQDPNALGPPNQHKRHIHRPPSSVLALGRRIIHVLRRIPLMTDKDKNQAAALSVPAAVPDDPALVAEELDSRDTSADAGAASSQKGPKSVSPPPKAVSEQPSQAAEAAGKIVRPAQPDRKEYYVRVGGVPGQRHRIARINNQDKQQCRAFDVHDVTYTVGMICDGCSTQEPKTSHNEVGARLLSDYATFQINLLLQAGMPLKMIPEALYGRCIGYLDMICRATVMGPPEALWEYIRTRLLCTLLGFVSDGRQLIRFSAGDGIFIVNDRVEIIDQNDVPAYMAYHLISRDMLGPAAEKLPRGFDTVTYDVQHLERFAMASDGLKEPQSDGSRTVPPAVIAGIWDNQPRYKAGLQYWLNGLSEEGHFDDDCTVIALGPKPEGR